MEQVQGDQSGTEKQVYEWQKKLLPWFVAMPTLLIGVFVFLATQQMTRFNRRIQTTPDTTLISTILPFIDQIDAKRDLQVKEKMMVYTILTRLEQESTFRRYNQAATLLMSRIFTKYLGFFTGMILAIVGSIFIIGKIREDTSKISGNLNDLMKFSIISSSPGIVFAVLGTVLMLTTILKHNDITVQDTPLYLNAGTLTVIELKDIKLKTPEIKADTGAFEGSDSMWSEKK